MITYMKIISTKLHCAPTKSIQNCIVNLDLYVCCEPPTTLCINIHVHRQAQCHTWAIHLLVLILRPRCGTMQNCKEITKKTKLECGATPGPKHHLYRDIVPTGGTSGHLGRNRDCPAEIGTLDMSAYLENNSPGVAPCLGVCRFHKLKLMHIQSVTVTVTPPTVHCY